METISGYLSGCLYVEAEGNLFLANLMQKSITWEDTDLVQAIVE